MYAVVILLGGSETIKIVVTLIFNWLCKNYFNRAGVFAWFSEISQKVLKKLNLYFISTG